MITKEDFERICEGFSRWCENDAAKYKIALCYLHRPDQCEGLRARFLGSDIVEQIYREQSPDGNWGPLRDKDYSSKAAFPTTFVAIERCLYIGLIKDDRDVLAMGLNYLEGYLRGEPPAPLYDKNERAIPWQMCDIGYWVERISPNHPLCDRLFGEWTYIAARAFEDGEYSYERDMRVQHDVLGTREKRLVPLPVKLLLARRADLPDGLEDGMLHHFGKKAFANGHFWDKNLLSFPKQFTDRHTRRWFHTIKYINEFHNADEYLKPAIDWLLDSRNSKGHWDYGPQVNDPWGYFGNFSLNRRTPHNREVDCTMEVLDILNMYMERSIIRKKEIR